MPPDCEAGVRNYIHSMRFSLRGVDGRVLLRYEVNKDPARWGFDRLGLNMDVGVARGFPVIEGRVEYPAEGYLGLLGWIQAVDYTVRKDSGEEVHIVAPDVAPQTRGANTPYLSFGTEPRLFDAPAFTEKDVDWNARAFLTYTPDLLMTPVVEPLCGVFWGYEIDDGAVTPKPLRAATIDDWTRACELLRPRLPAWTFGGAGWEAPGLE